MDGVVRNSNSEFELTLGCIYMTIFPHILQVMSRKHLQDVITRLIANQATLFTAAIL